ncbi:MAG TPA: luciferase family protein [Actinomycetota bacterium]|jgi:hypothetical protein
MGVTDREAAGTRELIETEVGGWPGVTTHPHRFGGVEFRVGRVELGHLHGGHLADLPMPRRIRDQLVAEGRALPHHVLPDSGWVSRRIEGRDDAKGVVELFRMNYERVRGRKGGAGA